MIVYYYNTVDLLSDEPRQLARSLPETEVESEHLPTIESISEERKKRNTIQAQLEAQQQKEAASAQQNAKASEGEDGIEELEEEADQQGAFNPETGEINWDCPCLGGMASGVCGEEFKAAFSCFVYSKEEPKGMDCIDKFKGMQDCFRQYPEIYGSEIDNDDTDDSDTSPADLGASEPAPGSSTSSPSSPSSALPQPSAQGTLSGDSDPRLDAHVPEEKQPSRREAGLVPQNYQPGATNKSTDNKDAQNTSSSPYQGGSSTAAEQSTSAPGQAERK